MEKLTFDTGIKEYEVNGGEILRFNPSDSAFVGKLFNAFDSLDKKQEIYRAQIDSMKDKREIFEIAHKQDIEMRTIIDGVFGPICDSLFGDMNVYAMADGLPVWCNFLLAIIDEVDTSFAREQKKTNPRIAKYTAKYHK